MQLNQKPMKPIMIVGTASDVGKSLIVTGICRWLVDNGYHPAPFKAQNISLNSFATPDGLEIGRAQAVQAEACKIPCETTMNPVLVKPSGTNASQTVLHGKPVVDQHIKEYLLGNNKENLFSEVKKAFYQLSSTYSPIVMEGAGSISELNLKHRDIVNMRMAKAANACVYLVADIDKGGVFGSVYGTIALLEDWEKPLLKGIIINKFRGDSALFNEGKQKLEEITGYPVLGVLPYDPNIYLEEEDSVALNQKQTKWKTGKFNVAVVQFHYLSNHTDFNALELHDHINVFYTRNPSELEKADVIILPGTKNTIADLQALSNDGLDQVIKRLYRKKTIIGICGGYQMMGKQVNDPDQVEGGKKTMPGLGFFDIETTLLKEKKTVRQNFRYKESNSICTGYEIHMGATTKLSGNSLNLVSERPEGYWDGKAGWGTYFHGIFDNAVVIEDLLKDHHTPAPILDYGKLKEESYSKLSSLIQRNLNMQKILDDIRPEGSSG